MSHFNEILHYVVDIFKDLRDAQHCLTGPVNLKRHTVDGNQYLFVSCEINLLEAIDCEALSNRLKSWFISEGKLLHIIDVERARSFDEKQQFKDTHYGWA